MSATMGESDVYDVYIASCIVPSSLQKDETAVAGGFSDSDYLRRSRGKGLQALRVIYFPVFAGYGCSKLVVR
jgi:hypothetical protein